jgi:hypothetical protein
MNKRRTANNKIKENILKLDTYSGKRMFLFWLTI